MKLVTLTSTISERFGDRTAVRLIKEGGFDAIDYSMFSITREDSPLVQADYREYAAGLREYAKNLGIGFSQGHAPFPTYKVGDDPYNERLFSLLVRSLEVSSLLGIKRLVVHPVHPTQLPPGRGKKEFNMEFYGRLLPYAKEYGVVICLENMFSFDSVRGCIVPNVCSLAEEFVDFLDSLDSEWFTACLDVGHCVLVGEKPEDAIRTLGGDRLKALHIHDNNYRADQHLFPYFGKIDWDAVTAALREIGYQGEFTFEADGFFRGLPADETVFRSALRLGNDIGRYLLEEIGG